MASQRKVASNRINAENSSGPRSVEGKARSSMNALKTGIYAEGAVIRGESPVALQLLGEQFHAEYHPVTPTERSLVDTLIQSEWTLRRCRWLETEIWRTATADLTAEERDISVMGHAFAKKPSLSRLHRLRNSAQRHFFEALNSLLRLRRQDHETVDPIPLAASRRVVPELIPPAADAPAPEIGFVPSNCPPSPDAAADPLPATAAAPQAPRNPLPPKAVTPKLGSFRQFPRNRPRKPRRPRFPLRSAPFPR